MLRYLVRLVLCLAFVVAVCAGVAQAQDLSVRMADTPVLAALQALSLQAGVKLSAQDTVTGKVTLNLEHVTLTAVLEEICRQLGCRYEKTNDGYVLLKGQLTGAAATHAPGENRVANGGFEADLADWVALDGGGKCEIVTDPVAGGQKALKISGQIGDRPQGVHTWPNVRLAETRHYRFRMQYRTEGQPRLVVRMTARDYKGGAEHPCPPHSVVAGLSPDKWSTLETEYWICDPSEQADLMIIMQQSSGAVWVDDISFEPIEFIGAQEPAATDLSYNGGFEEGVGDLPYGWCPANPNLWPLGADTRAVFGEKVAFTWDHGVAHGGECSVAISNDGGPDEKTYLNWHRILPLRAGCDYDASVWIKTEAANKAYLVMSAYTPSGPASGDSTSVIAGTTDWTEHRVTLHPKEVPDLAHGRLTIFLVLRGSGKVWFDDVKVTVRPRN
ncbi:hypothetical protein LLH23_09610 [bacterium]|nr:hypothetical protein [bacterium]